MAATTSAHPTTTQRTLIVGTLTPDQITTQEPLQTPGSDDYVATLAAAGLGSPIRILGHRVNGRPYDEVTLQHTLDGHGNGHERRWTISCDTGDEVDYRLTGDTSSTGYTSVDR